MAEPPGPDEGISDDVEEVIDDVLGENLPPPEPEDPWERRQRVIDTLTAVILAVAAVATAWATFQASQWAGAQSDEVAAAGLRRADAVRAATRAGEIEQVDTATWLQWLEASSRGDARRARFLDDRFGEVLTVAHRAWLAGAERDAEGRLVAAPEGTPFTRTEYDLPERTRADALEARSEELVAESQEAATRSTQFVTVALVLALTLFFAGIATKFRNPKLQAALVLLSLLTCTIGVIRLLTLPQLI